MRLIHKTAHMSVDIRVNATQFNKHFLFHRDSRKSFNISLPISNNNELQEISEWMSLSESRHVLQTRSSSCTETSTMEGRLRSASDSPKETKATEPWPTVEKQIKGWFFVLILSFFLKFPVFFHFIFSESSYGFFLYQHPPFLKCSNLSSSPFAKSSNFLKNELIFSKKKSNSGLRVHILKSNNQPNMSSYVASTLSKMPISDLRIKIIG